MAYVEITEPRPHVSLIALNRPERMNALSFETVQPLHEAILEVGADNDTYAAILTGAGRGFCSGLDLEDHGIPPNIAGLPMSRIATRAMAVFADLVPAMRNIPQPVIGAINGARPTAAASASPSRATSGSAPPPLPTAARASRTDSPARNSAISWLLPRMIGAAHAFELILSGREIDAREAERIGLVSRVVPDAELLDVALESAGHIAALSPHGVAMTKRVLWSNLETGSLHAAMDLESRNQLLVRLTTNNLDEAIRARKENRKPDYTD